MGTLSRGLTRSVSPSGIRSVSVSTPSWKGGVAFCDWLVRTTSSIREVCACLQGGFAQSSKQRRRQLSQGPRVFLDPTSFTVSLSVWEAVVPSLRRHVSRRMREDRENDPRRRRRPFTFSKGTAAPLPDNRPTTPDFKRRQEEQGHERKRR